MTKKNKVGRPAVELSEEQISEVRALSSVLSKDQVADYFGVSHVTFNAIEKRQPEVELAYKQGKARAIADIAGNLIGQARQGNTAASIFYLKTQAGWKETKVVETFESEKASNRHFIDE